MDDLLPLEEAISKIDAKTPIGSALRSADWDQVPVALRERAQFSSGVTSARVLQTIQDRLSAQVKLQREQLANGKVAIFDRSSFIDSVRSIARDEGLTPDKESDRGGLADITSIPRLGLIYDTQNQMAAGFARWKLDQTEGALLLYPAYEFVRVEDRKTPREESDPGFWDHRWIEAANEVGDDDAVRVFRDSGRKIALKNSGIWAALSRFGTPWMPFDWGSGMGVEDVDRGTCVSLGLIDENEIVESGEQGFNDDLQASVRGIGDPLKSFLGQAFGNKISFDGDTANWSDTEDEAPEKPRAFATRREAIDYMDANYHPNKLDFLPVEKAELIDYQNDNTAINKALFKNRELSPDLKVIAKLLDAAFEKASLPESMIVYRGMKGHHWDSVQAGQVISQPGYLSTSLDRSAAETFQEGALLKISVPKGAKAIYMDNLNGSHGYEAELAVARGSKIKLISKQKVGNVWQIEAELIL